MARNWAICVGVNEYDNLPNLKFAKRDAEQMQQYFLSDVEFDKVYLFTDDSPPIDDADKPYASRPTYGALRRFLRVRFDEKFLSDGDNLWFFFSGHGIRHQDRDYLLPTDADPDPAGIEDTAIPISYVSERLRRSGADNVILVLDACRNEQSSKSVGIGYEKQQGVITFSSCSPAERSYEVEALEQGSFTYALLESLRIQGEGNCATVERLSQRIKYRVSEINRDYEKPKQTPYPAIEPASKYHLILLPHVATDQDISQLREAAYDAEINKNWDLARQLWLRVNIAAKGTDPKAIQAIERFSSFGSILKPVEPIIKKEMIAKNVALHASPTFLSIEEKSKSSSLTDTLSELTDTLSDFAQWIAKLLRGNNWFELLLLIDASVILFGRLVANFLWNLLGFDLPENFNGWLWIMAGGIFLAAIVFAIITMPERQE